MELRTCQGSLAAQRCGCIVAGVWPGSGLEGAAAVLDKASGGALARVLARGDLAPDAGSHLLLHDLPGLACERVLLVGLGERARFSETGYVNALCAAMAALQSTGAADAVACLHQLPVPRRDARWKLEQAARGMADAGYRFEGPGQRVAAHRPALHALLFHLEDPDASGNAEQALAHARAIAEGVRLARDLGNLPPNACTPAYLADQAVALGARHGWEVTVLGPQEMEALGMHGLLAVARGSRQPPRLAVVEHRGGAPGDAPVALVGKGITFDSGGLCIKPAAGMDEMKFDMCGAASVLGALHAAALMRLPLNIVGILAAAENMPDGNATRPGDVVRTLSGLTVEILDTDSEGRLVLCDALAHAQRFRPAALVDVATLTAEIVGALGDAACGLFCNDDALAAELLAAGDRAWDRAWRMPMWEEHAQGLVSSFADLPNIASPQDCTAVPACFLSRFAGDGPWAHLDIAGVASRGGERKGATGRPVALLAQFLASRAGRS